MKADLVDHRKFLRLARLLGEPKPHVIGYLVLMWRRGYQTGNPLLGDELDVEAAAEYMGEPRKFATAAHSAGFIDLLPDGTTYRIHDLWDHAPEWARKRMARNGHLPEGVSDYCGIRAKSRRPAVPVAVEPPRGGENSDDAAARHTEKKGERRERKGEREENDADADCPPTSEELVTMAILEVSGADPVVNAAHVGRLRKKLLAAAPPYTAAEILALASPEFLSRELAWRKGGKFTLGEIESYIGRVRNPSQTPLDSKAGKKPKPASVALAEAEAALKADQPF